MSTSELHYNRQSLPIQSCWCVPCSGLLEEKTQVNEGKQSWQEFWVITFSWGGCQKGAQFTLHNIYLQSYLYIVHSTFSKAHIKKIGAVGQVQNFRFIFTHWFIAALQKTKDRTKKSSTINTLNLTFYIILVKIILMTLYQLFIVLWFIIKSMINKTNLMIL